MYIYCIYCIYINQGLLTVKHGVEYPLTVNKDVGRVRTLHDPACFSTSAWDEHLQACQAAHAMNMSGGAISNTPLQYFVY